MLTADLVACRRVSGELRLIPLDPSRRATAKHLAETLVALADRSVGTSRDELLDSLASIEVDSRDRRLRDGLAKLLLDRCVFDTPEHLDPPALRQALFTRATEVRRSTDALGAFDRNAVLCEVALAHGLDAEGLERAVFADLRGEQLLRAWEPTTPEGLVSAWERGQAQAVLLRAVRVTLDLGPRSPGATRALLRRLKFLRLMFTVERTGEGHRLVIDGPFSLFEASTKYGLELGLVLPVLEACDHWSLEADIRWGKSNEPLVFRLARGKGQGVEIDDPPLPDDLATLVRVFQDHESGWRARAATEILELTGVGLCIPDLVFERGGRRVYFEALGFWSRDAVWRRVELVQQGLGERVLFAVSERLRVSEAVLGAEVPGGLYVYKATMSPRAIVERLERLIARDVLKLPGLSPA